MRNHKLLTTKEAIENRRSIRKFKSNTIPDEIILALLESARLAPSGCNAQPWRFKIVKDNATKKQLQTIAYDQSFLTEAPVVLVICADLQGYLDGRTSGVQDLGKIGAFSNEICEILHKKTRVKSQMSIENLSISVAFNVAIAIEHIVLRALDFGLGTCWMRLTTFNLSSQDGISTRSTRTPRSNGASSGSTSTAEQELTPWDEAIVCPSSLQRKPSRR